MRFTPSLMPVLEDTALVEVTLLMERLIGPSPTEPGSCPATGKAARYHFAAGGRRVRARFALHACQALRVARSDAVRLAAATELLHNASLIHDDLHDQERVRRGHPTVWCTFGKDIAICAGDLLLSAAYGALAEFSNPTLLPSLLRRVHERTSDAIIGQSAELSSKDCVIADVVRYERIVAGKSGALLSLPMELAFIAASQPHGCDLCREAALAFGLGYQMFDDLEDLSGDAARQALNIVLVLRAGGAEGSAISAARELALRHLDRSVELAGQLPGGVGNMLAYFAVTLSTRARGGKLAV